MAGGLLDEIFIALGVKVDSKELNKFEKQLDALFKKLNRTGKNNKGGKGLDALNKGFHIINGIIPKFSKGAGQMASMLGKTAVAGGAVAGAIGAILTAVVITTEAINKMTESLARNNQYLMTFQRRTGMSAYNASGMASTASFLDMNVSEAQAMNEMQGLQSRLMELSLTGQGAMPFQLAGINPVGMNAEDIMRTLNKRMQGMSAQQQAYLADQLGLSSNLPLLQLNPEQFEKSIAENKQLSLTDDQLEQLMEYGYELKKINKQWDLMYKKVILLVGKPFVKMGKAIANFAEQLQSITTSIGLLIKRSLELHPILQSIVFTLRLAGAIIRDIWVMFEDILAFLSGSEPSLLGERLGFDSFEEAIRKTFPLIDKMYEVFDKFNEFLNRNNKDNNKAPINNSMDVIETVAKGSSIMINPYQFVADKIKEKVMTQNNTFYNVREGENESILQQLQLYFNGAST